jgi:hypothetical protein
MTRPWTDEEDEILTRYASQQTNGNVNWLRTQHYMPWRSVQQMRARWKRIRERDPSWKRTRKLPVRRSSVMSKKSKTGIAVETLFPLLHDYVVWQPTTYDEVGGHAWLDPLFEECEECEE